MNNDVTFQRPEIAFNEPQWALVNDMVAGSAVVKAAGETYLPKPNPLDTSPENKARYEQYLFRAAFFNATSRTSEGLIGTAFRRGPEIEIPTSMDFILTDTDGKGGGIHDQAHQVLEYLMKTGRAGLLADYPVRNTATSKAQQTSENIHATITAYPASSIINWRIDDEQDLVLVVLHTVVEEPDGFGFVGVNQWRELAISTHSEDPDGPIRYIVRIWRIDDTTNEPFIYNEYIPLDAAGREWSRIPFSFIGAIDNNADIDKAPLYDLAVINGHHYLNSADYQESSYMVGQPTYAVAGLDDYWMDHVWGDGFYVGSRAFIPLPVGGSIQITQPEPNILPRQSMKDLQDQMIALGARLMVNAYQVKTAEQSRSETASAHSVLSLAVDNLAKAYTRALEWVAEFTSGAEGEISFVMPTDFTGLNADPNLVTALVAGWQSGAIPRTDLWAAMRQLGVIDPEKDNDQLEDELDSEGGGLELDQ